MTVKISSTTTKFKKSLLKIIQSAKYVFINYKQKKMCPFASLGDCSVYFSLKNEPKFFFYKFNCTLKNRQTTHTEMFKIRKLVTELTDFELN